MLTDRDSACLRWDVQIIQVADIPYTVNMKRVEVPVKKVSCRSARLRPRTLGGGGDTSFVGKRLNEGVSADHQRRAAVQREPGDAAEPRMSGRVREDRGCVAGGGGNGRRVDGSCGRTCTALRQVKEKGGDVRIAWNRRPSLWIANKDISTFCRSAIL